MLVVKKGGGRNINNDRLIYINVDDSPAPIPELRRLLDMNMVQLYQGRLGGLVTSGDYKGAQEVAGKLVRYSTNAAQAHMSYGMLSYLAGDKDTAAAELKQARDLNPNLRTQMENAAKNRPQYAAILKDDEFLKKIFP
jgi:uncharacterized Ntn-hydrolase superfamily protein